MGIQKDAGEILLFIYQKYIEKHSITLANIEILNKETGWEKVRIKNAVQYLGHRKLVDISHFAGGGDFNIYGVYPNGVDIIENKQKFKNTFGFGINFGLINFSWNGARK